MKSLIQMIFVAAMVGLIFAGVLYLLGASPESFRTNFWVFAIGFICLDLFVTFLLGANLHKIDG